MSQGSQKLLQMSCWKLLDKCCGSIHITDRFPHSLLFSCLDRQIEGLPTSC